MSIRDELAQVVWEAVWDGSDHDFNLHDDVNLAVADAVLAYLGDLDRDADPELIALHLRYSRAETQWLRERMVNQSAEIERLLEVRDAALAVHQQGYPWGAYVRWREEGDAVAGERLDEVAAASKRLADALEAEMADRG